jgi:hypothetical protein
MTIEPIKKQISNVFGILIDNWEDDFKQFDAENRLNNKAVNKILLVILKRLEELEKNETTE